MKLGAQASVGALVAAGCLGLCSAAQAQEGTAVALPEIIVQATPVPSSNGIALDKVPATISVVDSKEFRERYSPSVTDAIAAHVPGAINLNIDGSDLSPDLYYRGYDASRITGTAEGLAVYENGVRINEAFGDVVNLDLIPPIAIADATVYTANPIFGLNALGGAINFVTKNGFNFHGGDFTILGGSYGRVNGYGEYGKQVGNYSFYFAGDGYRDGGYRPFGAQNAQRALADLGYRSQDSELHLIGQFGRSLLGVQGVTPSVLVQQQYNSVFTTPQTTNNQAGTAQLTGAFNIAPHWVINSNFYVRQFDQYHVDGNDGDITDCSENTGPKGNSGQAGTLCLPSDDAGPGATPRQLQFVLPNGKTIASMGANTDNFPYGTTALTSTHTIGFGTEQQITNTDKIYGHDNYFVLGGSVDVGSSHFSSSTVLGQLDAQFQNIESGIPGAGAILQTRGNVGFNSAYLAAQNEYYGIFALDTFNVTNKLAVTGGARFNVADIATQDLSGADPTDNASHNYDRINPTVGLTYEFDRAFTAYGSYSETNRAPTPLESNCANPAQPCLLETALVSDPRVSQVVARTFEGGGRGTFAVPSVGGLLTYKAGYFHSAADNDILSEPSPISGQGYYTNVPETLRQGVEFGVTYDKGPLHFYGNYAFVKATYQFSGQLSSPMNVNPIVANNNGIENIVPGDNIPGIPRNIGKLGYEYQLTPKLLFGMDAVIVGSQYFVGDDINQNPQLPLYYYLNFHASYQLTDHIQLIGIVNNFTNNHYATYGTYYDTGTDAGNINSTLAANANSTSINAANSVTVAQPLSVYGGIKVSF